MFTTLLILVFLLVTALLATGTGWNNVLSPDRNELVFAGRHREYGAYKLRQEHPRTMVLAMFIGVGLVSTALLLPTLFRGEVIVPDQVRIVEINDRILEIINPVTRTKVDPLTGPKPATPQPSGPVQGAGPLVAVDTLDKTPIDTAAVDPGPKPDPNPGTGGDPGKLPTPGGGETGGETGGTGVYSPWELDKNPEYPGGEKALGAYLSRSIHYPEIDITARNEGRVTVGFIVRTDGSVTDVSVLQGVSPTIDAEAVRVVKAMIKWIPGKFKQQEANVRYALPIVFKLAKN